MIYRFDTLTSTNDEAAETGYGEGDVVVAESQTKGRGQRGHSWESAVGQNLTFSLVLEPHFLAPQKQFLLSEVVALAMVDMLAAYGIVARIKWTNDIYVGDKKIAGILIEHKLQGLALARTIVGIGLNINQMEFSEELPNPISMRQVRSFDFEREEVLERLCYCLMQRYEQLRAGQYEQLQEQYHERLYRLGALQWFSLPSGRRFRGTIVGVRETGALCVEDEKRERKEYLFKEIELMVGHKVELPTIEL